MSQVCGLCDGDGISPHDAHARCGRCDGAGSVADSMDQTKPIMERYRCGRCGGVHEAPDTQYAPPWNLPCPPNLEARR